MLTLPKTPCLQPGDSARSSSPALIDDAYDEWEPEEYRGREPLPAGDRRSWGAITAGTVLEGMPYPLPVFER